MVYRAIYKDATTQAGRVVRNYRAKRMRKRIQKGRVGVTNSFIRKNQNKITYLPSSSLQMPLPRCYHTRFTIEREFLIPASTSVQNINSVFKLNSPIAIPLDNNVWTPDITQLFPYFNNNQNGVSVIAQECTGLSYLLGPSNTAPYSRFTVISSMFEILLEPTTDSDKMCGVVLPMSDNASANLQTGFLKAQPNIRYKEFEQSKGKQYLRKSQYVHSYLGVAKKALIDDLSGNYDGRYDTDPANKVYWKLVLNRCGSSNTTAGDIVGHIRITYNICLWNSSDGTFYEGVDDA